MRIKKKITRQEVKHVAKLANLPLKERETRNFSAQLSEITDYNMSLLEKIETNIVEPTAHITGVKNVQRADETEAPINQEEALKNAKETHNGFFKVKAILDLPAGRQGQE